MITIIQALVCAAAAGLGAWMGVPGLRGIAGDMISAFTILAAFTIQIMVLFATILSPGRLAPDLFDQIADELDNQQRQASLLLAFYLLAVVMLLGVKASGEWKPTDMGSWFSMVAGAVTTLVSAYALLRTVGFIRLVRILQSLRHKLLRRDLVVQRLASGPQSVPALDELSPETHNRPYRGL